MVFYILVVYFCTTLISQVFLLLQIFNTVTLRMPFTRNHYHGTGSAKHSSYSYMTRALRALVCNWMSSYFAKPSSVIMISCKRYMHILCTDARVCIVVIAKSVSFCLHCWQVPIEMVTLAKTNCPLFFFLYVRYWNQL